MRPNITNVRVVWLSFFLLTSGIARAAEPVLLLPDTIPLFQYGFSLALSVMGGLANALKRWSTGYETKSVKLSIASDSVSSVSAGMMMYFAATHFNPPSAVAVIAIFLAGFGGARFLDFVYGKMESFIGRKVDKEIN